MMLFDTKVNNYLLLKLGTVTDCFGSEPHWVKKAQVLVQRASGTHEGRNCREYSWHLFNQSLKSGMGSLSSFPWIPVFYLLQSVVSLHNRLHHDRLKLLKLGRPLNPPSLCCFCQICYINRKWWLTLLLCVPSLSKNNVCQISSRPILLSPSTLPCSPHQLLELWSFLSRPLLYDLKYNPFAQNFLHHLRIPDIGLSPTCLILWFLQPRMQNYLKWGKKTQTTVVGCAEAVTPLSHHNPLLSLSSPTQRLWHQFLWPIQSQFLTIQAMLGVLSYQ